MDRRVYTYIQQQKEMHTDTLRSKEEVEKERVTHKGDNY